MRASVKGDMRFVDLLARVREVALGAYKNQDIPFEYLVEDLRPSRSMSYSPLFQVMFALQNLPNEQVEAEGLKFSMVQFDYNVAKFDLTLSMYETESGLQGNVEYNADLFDAQTIKRLIEHYRMLIDGVIEDPRGRIGSFQLLTPRERQQVLVEWNATGRECRDGTLHGLFMEQANGYPGGSGEGRGNDAQLWAAVSASESGGVRAVAARDRTGRAGGGGDRQELAASGSGARSAVGGGRDRYARGWRRTAQRPMMR
jgi:non-ribosomal peptide synthetase component F